LIEPRVLDFPWHEHPNTSHRGKHFSREEYSQEFWEFHQRISPIDDQLTTSKSNDNSSSVPIDGWILCHMSEMVVEGKARQGKARQGKARQGKGRQTDDFSETKQICDE
jgi:hypothetical protein